MLFQVIDGHATHTRVVAAAIATLQALGITERHPQDVVDAHVSRMRPNGFGDLFEFRSGNSDARMAPTGQPCPGSFAESPGPQRGPASPESALPKSRADAKLRRNSGVINLLVAAALHTTAPSTRFHNPSLS